MIEAKAINHIGIAVASIDADTPFYRDVLGAEFEGVEVVEDQKVKVAFFALAGVRLELLEPTIPDSTIAKFIEYAVSYIARDDVNPIVLIRKISDNGTEAPSHGIPKD